MCTMNFIKSIGTQLPNTLQIGDYIPFVKIDCIKRKTNIHSFCNSKPFMLVTMKCIDTDVLKVYLQTQCNDFNIIVLFEEGNPECINTNIVFTQDLIT